jgi:hypothetical protein
VRYCGNARVRILWCPGASPSPEEPKGAFHFAVRVGDARGYVVKRVFGGFIFDADYARRYRDVHSTLAQVYKVFDEIACEVMNLALADEDARGALSPDLDNYGNPRIHR